MSDAPILGDRAPQRWPRPFRWFGRFLLAAVGWRFSGAAPNLPKFVIIAAPHTSNWDFLLGVAAIFALGIDLHYMGKHTLFKGPFGWLFRGLGGVPVDRRAPGGTVDQMVAEFENREQFVLAIAPEGTRSKVKRWKTGFYYIAMQAGVAIIPVALNYGRKQIEIGAPFWPTGDKTADVTQLRAFYDHVQGKHLQ